MFYRKASTEGLSPQFLEQDVAKSLKHSLTKEDLKLKYGNLPENSPQYVHFRDYIPRLSTSSSVTIEGVKNGENPDFTTMWADVGFSLATVSIPLWLKGGEKIAEIVAFDPYLMNSPICNAALILKNKRILNIRWGGSDRFYIDINAIYNSDNTGIIQKLRSYENHVYEKAGELINGWRQKGSVDRNDIRSFYKWVDGYVTNAYREEFNIEMMR